jgi:putative ABC transport system permease protein
MDQERTRELAAYVEVETQENIARGMSAEEARFAAHRKLGNATLIREEIYKMNSIGFLETLWQDVRFALRMLRKNPGFSAVAILTLALGIGANTAIFSVVYAVLLKPLPYPKSEQLVNVFQAKPSENIPRAVWASLTLEELRAQNKVFSGVAGVARHQLTLTGRGDPTVVNTNVVTPELFALLGTKPIAGRGLLPEDGKNGAAPVVVLGEEAWRGLFDADPNVVGTSIGLDKKSFTIVGIMPSSFRFPAVTANQQVWIPVAQDPLFSPFMSSRRRHFLGVIGRLKPGVSQTEAQADLDAVGASLAKEFPAENSGWESHAEPLQQVIVGSSRSALLVLLGAVGLVLLIACANIANLLLSRATSRTREMAVRTALGAGRMRIVRQLLSETAVLGLFGGAAGVAIAYWGVQALSLLLPPPASAFVSPILPEVNTIRVDNFVLGFALLLSAFASFAFGLAPALFASNSNLQTSLREGEGRSGESGGRRRARSILAAAEIALAMVLLVSAGLLLRSFTKLTSVNPGYEAKHVLKADVSLPRFQYSTPQQWSTFSDQLMTRIKAEPGLQNSAMVVPAPMISAGVELNFEIVGTPPPSAGSSRSANYVSVTPDYFHVLGIPLLAGRYFNDRDAMSAPRVTVISQAMAKTYFPNESPIGKHLVFAFRPDPGVDREIVGVVGDIRDVALSQKPGPMMYVPFAQAPFWGGAVIVKSSLSASEVTAAIRRDVRALDPDLPVTDVEDLSALVDASAAQPKFRTSLLGIFAAIALILAVTGIFGVISYSVSRRTHEIGIRVALGASRAAILKMILRETLMLTFTGLAIGIPCALAASRLVANLLYGVSPSDPATVAAVALILTSVAVLAGYIPARQAMQVDPMVALRHE